MNIYLLIIIGIGLLLMILERIWPDVALKMIPGRWSRVFIINFLQLGIVVLGGLTWDQWPKNYSFYQIHNIFSDLSASFILYVLITFVFLVASMASYGSMAMGSLPSKRSSFFEFFRFATLGYAFWDI